MKKDAKAGRVVVTAVAVGVWCAVAGCTSAAPAEVRKPAMPTVGARTVAPVTATSAAEKLVAARRLADTGDLVRAAEMLGGGEPVERARIVRELTAELAARDPARAVGLADALPAGSARSQALELGARAWAKRDGEAALRWALDLTEAREGSLARRVVADERVAANARETIERLMALPAGGGRDEMLGFAAAAWARREPERAVEWVRGQADDELKTRLLAGVGFELAQSNPSRAKELAEALPAGRNRWLLTGALAQTWVNE